MGCEDGPVVKLVSSHREHRERIMWIASNELKVPVCSGQACLRARGNGTAGDLFFSLSSTWREIEWALSLPSAKCGCMCEQESAAQLGNSASRDFIWSHPLERRRIHRLHVSDFWVFLPSVRTLLFIFVVQGHVKGKHRLNCLQNFLEHLWT